MGGDDNYDDTNDDTNGNSNGNGNKVSPMQGFQMIGVIKETGIDDEGLLEFKNKFFPYPLYLDLDLFLYKALGSNRLSVFRLLYSLVFQRRKMKVLSNRHKGKDIDGNLSGEGLLQGGVIIFDAHGRPRYAYAEKNSYQVVPINDLVAALNAIREESK